MDSNQEILQELKNINQKLDKITKPSKSIWLNFLKGTSHSLGTVFGTLIIASALIYLFARFNPTKSISSWIEQTMSQINWTKVVAPQTPTVK